MTVKEAVWKENYMSERQQAAREIRVAYKDAEKTLRRVGRLLRTTEAGRYMWSAEHKTAVSGLCVMLDKLAYDVPDYADDAPNTP